MIPEFSDLISCCN